MKTKNKEPEAAANEANGHALAWAERSGVAWSRRVRRSMFASTFRLSSVVCRLSSVVHRLFFVVRRPSSVVRPSSSASPVCRPSSVVCRLASGFTLLEVMLVVGIIAILVAMLFPVIIGVREKTKQRQATAEARAIALALDAYRQEYGKWPAQVQTIVDTTYVITNKCVIQPLLGSNWGGFNPKNKQFLSLPTNNLDYAGNYLDPWGIPYVVGIDQNEDNTLLFYYVGSYVASNPPLGNTNINLSNSVANTKAGAASLGKSSDTLNWKSW